MVAINANPLPLTGRHSLDTHKDSKYFPLHKNSHLAAMQFIKCLPIISFIGRVINATVTFVFSISLINKIKKKTLSPLNNKEVKTKNLFHALLKIPLSREATPIDDKHRKIALLLISYSCMNQLVGSYKEGKFEDLENHCSEKVESINQRTDISKIHKVSDEMVTAISKEKSAPRNLSVIFKHIFDLPPSDVMKMMAEICDELADEKGIAPEISFKNNAEKAREYAQLLEKEPYPNERHKMRTSMMLSTQST